MRGAIDEQAEAMREIARLCEKAGETVPVNVEEYIPVMRVLQFQQFIAVAMGLRAEWLRNAGFAAWLRLTVLSDALAGAKFMARFKQERVVFSHAHSRVTLNSTELDPEARHILAREVSEHGVGADALIVGS